ncbi:hypothetical protein V8F20_004210 [Naviculisporaceae sp. PSN 640]
MTKLLSLLAAGLLPLTGLASPLPRAVGDVRELYKSTDTFFENLFVLPNGNLLISTLTTNKIYMINPGEVNPTLQVVTTLTAGERATGIASVSPGMGGKYAAVSGFENGWILNDPYLNVFSLNGTVLYSIPGPPEPSLLNGLISLPAHKEILLSADSTNGRIVRWDTDAQTYDIAFSDPALTGDSNPANPLPLGVNGIKIRGQYLYFTNTFQGTFGRFKIDCNANKIGNVEILVQLPLPTGFTNAFDDFVFDGAGNAYITQHATSVIKVTPAGVVTTVAGTGGFTTPIMTPTAVGLSSNEKTLYVTTGMSEYSTGGIYAIEIPK